MSVLIELRVVELLSARLCHELVSPVGAVNNGVELLDEEDPEFVRDAIELIGQSARKAGQRLQFYRFAYGTTKSASGDSLVNGRDLAMGLLENSKVQCAWPAEATTLPVDWQRLACNMLVLGADTLSRGGVVTVRPLRSGAAGIEVSAEGESVNLAPEVRIALTDAAVIDELTSRTVQAYFTARLAEQLGARIALSLPDPARAVFTATVS